MEQKLNLKEGFEMKEFATISEHEILSFAINEIMERINREEEINQSTLNEYGRENSICQHHLAIRTKQLKEISVRILELESIKA